MKLRTLSLVVSVFFLTQTPYSQPATRVYCTRADNSVHIYSCNLDGSGVVELSMSATPRCVAIDWTSAPQRLYLALIQSSGKGRIIRCNTDGTDSQDVVTDVIGVQDIELDLSMRRIYWLQNTYDDDRIFHADMDGLNSNVTQIYATTIAMRDLWGLALDTYNKRLWITERGSTCYSSYIRTMTYGGSGVAVIMRPVCNPHDIEYFDGKIFWGEGAGLLKANPDGTGIDTLVNAADTYGLAIDGTHGRVYWSDYTYNNLKRVDIDGTNEMDVMGNVGTLRDVATDYSPSILSVDPQAGVPSAYGLLQNYPNPFNPSTTIKYELPQRLHVTLSLYNTLGQKVMALVDEAVEAGYHEVQFDAEGLASGVYLYRLQAGDFVSTKKLVILK